MTEDDFVMWAVDLPAREWTEFARRVWWMHQRHGVVSNDNIVASTGEFAQRKSWLVAVPYVEDRERWLKLRTEVRRRRRTNRSYNWESRKPENKEKIREYNRLYMREYRRRKKQHVHG